MAKRDYLLEAAKQIRMALDREVNEDYEAAFSYYKNGVDLLLNGVQVDPNKERREAVKRKTTQYLKRAEEIFISHLQDNLGKGSSHLGGYSSLRFRPIRHLSSPVEDLEMCKVVGVNDKVLVVQSLVNKETFVVKSLPKSSWESREQPTIIPQGVPYMVKLLRYYVSEDAVYLHLEHVQGGRLFSKLTKARSHRAMEHPDCSSPSRIKLRNSHTSPSLGPPPDIHPSPRGTPGAPQTGTQRRPDTEAGPSWEEAQRHLEGCGTHTYIEETGCLQNPRSTSSSSSSSSSQGRSEITPRLLPVSLHWPIRTHLHAANCHTSCSNAALPVPAPLLVSFARIGQAIDVVSELPGRTSGNGLLECSSDFERAWTSTAPESSWARGREAIGPPSDTPPPAAEASPPPLTSSARAASVSVTTPGNRSSSSPHPNSSSPAILHLHLDCQTQTCGSGTVSSNGFGSGSGVGPESGAVHQNQPSPVTTEEERRDTAVIRSTDRAVFSDTRSYPVVSLPLSVGGAGSAPSSGRAGEVVEEAWELLSPGGKEAPVRDADPQRRRGDMDAFLFSEGGRAENMEEQVMEVEGWCHLPSRGTGHRVSQACWGMPEAEVRVWGAQILLALESLHQQGVLCRDLNPNNVLLTSNGKVLLTFFSQWSEVQTGICSTAMQRMYCAPEIGGVSKPTEACDWWSLGALLFELLTGMPLWQFHPAGIHSHTQLLIPDNLSTAAASLLTELLQYDAGYRLGSGGGGVSDIKCHPFFIGVSWQALSY